MKKRWESKALGELCEIELGKTPARANASFWDDKRETGNVWLSIADLLKAEDNVVVNSKEYISDKGAAICKLVLKGTLLVSFKLTLGRLAFAGRDLFTNEAIAALTIFNERELSKEFLFYSLSFFDWVKAAENDVKLKGMTLNKAKLKVMPVSFPPLAEQQRIVGILDEAFAGIARAKANAEQNLQNARALFESHLQAVFSQRGEGWVETTVGAEIRFIDYRGKTPVKTEIGIRLITAKNVKMGYLQESPMEYIAADNYESWMTRGIPKKGDVLFTTEAPLANVAQLDTDEKVAFAQRIIIMQPNAEKLDCTFLKYLLLSQPVQERIRSKGTGATVQGIKASLLKTIEISFPISLQEQRRIVAQLDALALETRSLAAIYERKLAALEELKKSLLHQAFSGEL
jgi:type I restriction enzyme S subunit